MSEQNTGTVKFFNEEKRYGFISESGTGKDFFVHANNIKQPIKSNDKVEFDIQQGNKGPEAVNVRVV